MVPSRLERFRGLMVGTAVGDCLGRPVEGHRQVPASYLETVRTHPPALIYTDDTAMTMSLAESLLAGDGFDGADMSLRFARGYQADPYRGYGASVVDVFERVLRGVPWHDAAHRQFDGQGSFGNGAAMRVAPVALWAPGDIDAVVDLAENTARVTHTHPVGVEGAVIQAVAAAHALTSDPEVPFDTGALLEDLDRRVRTDEFRSKLEVLPGCLERGDDTAKLHLGNWVSADESVVTALYCFLVAADFTDTIVSALGMGGDTDTIAAMAGALAGARYGHSAIPPSWQPVEESERMVAVADALHHRVT